jgi:eukaryotic-like serine/threonine-protein kinase
VDLLRRLIGEAHRRSIWQVLGIYLVGAWVVYQVILGLVDGLDLPGWVRPFSIILFLIGLPIVLATAIVQEGGPRRDDFVRREPEPPAHGPQEPQGPQDRIAAERLTGDPTLFPGAYGSTAPGAPPVESRAGPGAVGGAPAGPGVVKPDGDTGALAAESATRLHGLLTWRRSLAAGVGAFVLLGLAGAGYTAMRVLGIGPVGTLVAKGVIDPRDRIVLADFRNATPDSLLGGVVTEAMRVDLLRSSVIRLAEPADVQHALDLMGRSPQAGLPANVARDVAARDGLKAVLAGDIGAIGAGYVLSAQLLATADGSPLAAFRETARDSTQLIDAIDRLSKDIREKIGDSLRQLRTAAPLEDVTTASLPALRKYSEGARIQNLGGDETRAAALFQQAFELDTTFAMAYRKYGIALSNLVMRRDRQIWALTRAYQLQNHLPERERYDAIGSYHLVVTGDVDAGIQAYRHALDVDPDDGVALNNLPVLLMTRRDFADAEPILRHGIQVGANPVLYRNLVDVLYAEGKRDEARTTLEQGMARFPGDYVLPTRRVTMFAADGRFAQADSAAKAYNAEHADNVAGEYSFGYERTMLAWATGRLTDAATHAAEQDRRSAADGLTGRRLWYAIMAAQTQALLVGDTTRARAEIDTALRRFPQDSAAPANWPYMFVAQAEALAGRPERAASVLDAYLKAVPADQRGLEWASGLSYARGLVALSAGRPGEAIDSLRVAAQDDQCLVCELPPMGRAFEALGQRDSAIAVYQRFLDTPDMLRFDVGMLWRGVVLSHLARLYDAAGDRLKAIEYYGRFADFWKDADPVLQPQVEAARHRMQALVAQSG